MAEYIYIALSKAETLEFKATPFIFDFPEAGYSVGTTDVEMVHLDKMLYFCYLLLQCSDKSKIQIYSAGFYLYTGR